MKKAPGAKASDKEAVAQKMRIIRKYCDKSQKEFAAMLNTSQSSLSLIEQGKALPSGEMLQMIIQMGFDVEWLLMENASANVSSIQSLRRQRINALIDRMADDELDFLEAYLRLWNEMGRKIVVKDKKKARKKK